MIERRTFLGVIAGGLLAAPLAVEGQQAATVRRIGVLGGMDPGLVEARKEGLRRLGWVEGQNIIVEHVPVGDVSGARLQELARDLVRLKVEVIMASSNPYIAAAKAATTTIPIVMVPADDPIRQGYVASLSRPGGNITGVTTAVPETQGAGGSKVFELLAECRPGLSRLAVLMDPNMPSYRTYWLRAEASAQSRGMAVQAVEVREAGELPSAFARIVKDRAQAIQVIGSPFIYRERGQIAELGVRHRLPTAYPWREGPEAGGLLSYGANLRAMWHRAAVYVDKILKGANPADLPIEQPTTFEVVINLKTAKTLGLTIPRSLLQRADQVIE